MKTKDHLSSADSGSTGIQKLVDDILLEAASPFLNVLSSEKTKRVFTKARRTVEKTGVYSIATVLWVSLEQVLRHCKGTASPPKGVEPRSRVTFRS